MRIIKGHSWIWVILIFPNLSGCSLGPKYVKEDFQPPSQVAVLPFSNETNDVEGPEIVRKILIELLPARGYSPIDKEKVDQILLEDLGISEGGQLTALSPEELGKALKVDGLFYGNLITFVDLPLGFTRRRTVKANLKLYDANTGELLWEDVKKWTTPEFHLSVKEAKKAAIKQVAERQIQKMRGTFLRQESILMLKRALENLPLGR